MVLKDRPEAYGLPDVRRWRSEPQEEAVASTREAQLEVLRNPAVWICAVASALMFVTRFGIKSWGVYYLQETHGFSLAGAGLMIGINSISGFGGSVAYGFVSDVVFKGRRPPATLLFGIVQILALVLMFYGPHSVPLLIVSLFVYGFALSGILAVLGGCSRSTSRRGGPPDGDGVHRFHQLHRRHPPGEALGLPDQGSHDHASGWQQPRGLLATRGDLGGASVASMLLATTLWRVRPRS